MAAGGLGLGLALGPFDSWLGTTVARVLAVLVTVIGLAGLISLLPARGFDPTAAARLVTPPAARVVRRDE